MDFIAYITSWVTSLAHWCLTAHDEVETWVFPFNLLAEPFFRLYWAFNQLAFHFWEWDLYIHDMEVRVSTFLARTDIYTFLQYYLDKAVEAWNWVQDVWNGILPSLIRYWEIMQPVVEGWITTAIQWFQDQIDTAITWLTNLQVSWDNFWSNILPTLATWLGIDNLIDSTLRLWFPFYDTLTALWDSIVEFFVDPLQWLYDQLDNFFERFW